MPAQKTRSPGCIQSKKKKKCQLQKKKTEKTSMTESDSHEERQGCSKLADCEQKRV